ncbi:unnamed protein product [Linum trigynum]|uniref:Uncharacterized protein n=1 Tax=Linum trigynum TaxID=586398 RepID=A0AAV2E8A1_9ROSI
MPKKQRIRRFCSRSSNRQLQSSNNSFWIGQFGTPFGFESNDLAATFGDPRPLATTTGSGDSTIESTFGNGRPPAAACGSGSGIQQHPRREWQATTLLHFNKNSSVVAPPTHRRHHHRSTIDMQFQT